MAKLNLFPKRWILLRGLTRSSFHWLQFEQKFKNFFQCDEVLTPEVAGNGWLFEELSTTHLDEAVSQVRNQISVEPNPNEIGIFAISMGGMIAARWAQLFPEEVKKLVLVNSSFSSFSPFYHRLRPHNYPMILENFLFYNPENLEKSIMQTTSNCEEKWTPHIQKLIEFQQSHPVSLANFIRQLKMTSETDLKKRPAAQILILTSKADRLVNFKCSQAIAKRWSSAIEIHSTAGHDLPLDDPDWIFEKMSEHFQREQY